MFKRQGSPAPPGRRQLWTTAALAVVTAAAVIAVAGIASGAGTSGDPVSNPAPAGIPVPAEYLSAVRSAALSCPMLSPARLAGQLMANSQFDAEHTTSAGGVGLAGLTDAAWDAWKPAAQARRGDATANIVALAHEMCDLSGRLRVAKVPGDMWRNALAAADTSLDDVRGAAGVPAVATGYVRTVVAYASWYSGHENLDATPPAPSAPPVVPATRAPSPVPSKARASASPAPSRSPAVTLAHACNSTAGSPICLRLVDQQTGRCLAIQPGSNHAGTVACPGDATSVWYWLQLGDGLPHIVNDAAGTCLDANDNRDVYVFQCQPGDPWETWVTVPGTQALQQKQTGSCLDSSDAGGAYTWACQGAGDGNEQWQQTQA